MLDIILWRHVATSRSIIVSLTIGTAVVSTIDGAIKYIYSLYSSRIVLNALMSVAQATGLSTMDGAVDAAVTMNYNISEILRTNKNGGGVE